MSVVEDLYEDFPSDEESVSSGEEGGDRLGCEGDLVLELLDDAPRKRDDIQRTRPRAVPSASPSTELTDFDRFLDLLNATKIDGSDKIADRGVGGAKDSLPPVSAIDDVSDNQVNEVSTVRELNQATNSKPPAKALNQWGVFSPEKMPKRLDSAAHFAVSSPETPKRKLKVLVPAVAYMANRSRRTRAPANRELTFRPTINHRYFRSRGLGRLRSRRPQAFTARMLQDISDRNQRHQKRLDDKKRAQQIDEEEWQERRHSLVAKGSLTILRRNGLWNESINDRVERLVQQRRTSAPTTRTVSKRVLRERERAKARACETLYQRGLNQLQHKQQKSSAPTVSNPNPRQSSRRSRAVARDRLSRDIEMICTPTRHDSGQNNSQTTSVQLPTSVSFVEFSCVLLYFGLVPTADTPREIGAKKGETLLWHAWNLYANGEGDDQRVQMCDLKALLESVIITTKPQVARRSMSLHHSQNDGLKARLRERFRLHYLARKRSKTVTTTSTARATQQVNVQTRYSLHGRPIRSPASERDDNDILARRHAVTQQRIEVMRREKERQEVAECSFRPNISSPSRSPSSNALLDGYVFHDGAPETFDRLYSDHFQRQTRLATQTGRAKAAEIEKWKKESRVSATYVNGMSIEERLGKLHESLSNNAVPVQYYEKIAEMRHVHATKLADAAEKANRLEPSRVGFPKTIEGRTLVVPFTFATQERMERSRKRDSASKTKTASDATRTRSKSNTAALLRDLRLQYEPVVGCSRAVADLCIDVHLSPFETYTLEINKDDNIEAVVHEFASRFNLDDGQRQQLQQHAQLKLKELIDLEI